MKRSYTQTGEHIKAQWQIQREKKERVDKWINRQRHSDKHNLHTDRQTNRKLAQGDSPSYLPVMSQVSPAVVPASQSSRPLQRLQHHVSCRQM